MRPSIFLKSTLLGSACGASIVTAACAARFDIPPGDLNAALNAYANATGTQLVVSSDAVRGIRTQGASGDFSVEEALSHILLGTGFIARHKSGTSIIVRDQSSSASEVVQNIQMAQVAPTHNAVETVTVTSSKLGGADVQSIPIAITALSQEQLTATQTAGGPDLVKQVPNLTFSKTNFTGYNIQIRGIGTQAISVTTDPAVAVAFNDIPFIRNHFFEQEFYDVSQVEVLRGPQGTLYGRNATAGVVNVTSARPSDQFEAMVSGDIGNYRNRRVEGMVNLPIVDDRLDIRAAGEWTKRDGYSFNQITGAPIDGRDLWSSRVSVAAKLTQNTQAYLIWEHFSESDDRLRSSKQLCKTDPTPTEIGGVVLGPPGGYQGSGSGAYPAASFLSQGCQMSSLYSADAFGVPNGFSLPYYLALTTQGNLINTYVDPYASTMQSRDLRTIESTINPIYKAKNDIVELNADYSVSSALSLISQTAFNQDFLYASEDYNRFNTSAGIFNYSPPDPDTQSRVTGTLILPNGEFCDPQLGCASRLVAEDLSEEHAWQFSQEFRLTSNFSGPLNFSAGGNYLHYETEENYFVFINALTIIAANPGFAPKGEDLPPWNPGVSDNHECLPNGFQYSDPTKGSSALLCGYIDPNPIDRLNSQGHNYFLSQNPYVLNSYAGFGEAYYNVSQELKLTGGLRWTEDQKHFVNIPSEVLTLGYGYPSTGSINQKWDEWTGRFAANWTPKVDFTDQTLVYGSYSHGYKAGGANPPGAVLLTFQSGDLQGSPVHPLTFKPEFIDAYEIGTKNTLFDGGLVLNGSAFYYNYKGYQISEIIDRTSINLNFDATVKGAELEATWEPAPGLKFNFAGGFEDTKLNSGQKAVDLMDRTAGHSDWVVVRPYVTQASNCVLPVYVIAANPDALNQACGVAYTNHFDPLTNLPYATSPTECNLGDDKNPNIQPCNLNGYVGFDPVNPDAANNGAGAAPNNGAGFDKDLSSKELPNAPRFTVSASADYTIPITSEWASTFHVDYYWQDNSWARVFNDNPYDRIRGYTNVNLALILTSQNGWQVMGYLKNVFNTTAITGAFLNSDDTGLTTNVFLTDPRLFGVRVTKNF